MNILDRFKLNGKTALVSGASRGIGKAMALALAEAGADIVATSAGLEPEGSSVAREIAALPQACLRSDRLSTLEGMSLAHDEAMANEFAHGMAVLADPGVVEGVSRFRGGEQNGAGRVQTQPSHQCQQAAE